MRQVARWLEVGGARRLLDDDRQGVLDLGITPARTKVVMVPPLSAAGLFADRTSAATSRLLVARPQVVKTSSVLVYDALAGVYAGLGFDAVGDEVFRALPIARIVEPTSLLDTDPVLAEMGRVSASHLARKRTLRRAHAGSTRAQALIGLNVYDRADAIARNAISLLTPDAVAATEVYGMNLLATAFCSEMLGDDPESASWKSSRAQTESTRRTPSG